MTDREWSNRILNRDKTCGLRLPGCTMVSEQAHHIIGRSVLRLRCDLDNGIGLCAHCHAEVERDVGLTALVLERIGRNRRRKLLWKVSDFCPWVIARYGGSDL